MSELFKHDVKCRPYVCICSLGNEWQNTYEFGVKRERARIIKLLEEEAEICYGLGFNPGKRLLDVILDRIKGENW